MMDIFERVCQFIRSEHLLSEVDHIDIALSGGADSVCLALILKQYQVRHHPNLSLRAQHIRHGLRESDFHDADIAAKVSRRLDIPYVQTDLHLSDILCAGHNIEESARQHRYDALLRHLNEDNIPKRHVLALAHHGDENLETALWRLGRGCGLEGLTLSPIRTREHTVLIRPLLVLSKDEIYQYLKDNGLPWAEDPTNQSDHYRRNRIRHDILPRIIRESMSPSCIYQSLIDIRHDTDSMTSLVESFVSSQIENFGGWFCKNQSWQSLNVTAQSQVIRHVCMKLVPGHCPTRQFIHQTLTMLENRHETHKIVTDETVSVGWSKDGVAVYTNKRPPLPDPIVLNLPVASQSIYEFGHLSVFHNIQPIPLKNTPEFFSYRCDSPSIAIKPASLIPSLVTSKHKQIKTNEALRSQGIPDFLRPYWPILCDGDKPIWVLGGMRTDHGIPMEPEKMAVSCIFKGRLNSCL